MSKEYLNDPLALAILFHVTYEKLAPQKGYETRQETRIFDPDSSNGKLMVATCAEIQRVISAPDPPSPELVERLAQVWYKAWINSAPTRIDVEWQDLLDIQKDLFRAGIRAVLAALDYPQTTICQHDRLNEDGICRTCGKDCRGIS